MLSVLRGGHPGHSAGSGSHGGELHQTVTTTQTLNTPGDTGRVEQGGIISVNPGGGIRATADGVTVNNAGSVTGLGELPFDYLAASGIRVLSSNTIINSGRVEGGVYGIRVAGTGNTIMLLSGSTIEGALDLGDASNRLIIGRGLDAAFTVSGTPSISTEDAAHVVSGSTVYTVNSTAFAVQDDLASDLTRAVTGAVEGRLAAARRLDGGLRVALNGLTIAAAADPSVAPDNGFWLSGLAASRSAKQDGDVAGFDTGLFLDSYRETGSAAALAMDERTISIFELRGEIAYDFAVGNLAQTVRIGVDGSYSDAADAAVTVAGQALAISVAVESLARGFFGYDAAYALGNSASLTFSTEAGFDTTEAVTLEARAGLSWRF